MKKSRKIIAVLVVVIAAGAFAGTRWLRGEDETYEFFTSAVTRQTIQNTIAATGNVSAMVMVEVGSQVTGQILSLYADFNSVVTEGQVLARLDPRNVETQLRNVQANLRSAESRIVTARAERNNSDVNLESAHANMETARLDLELAERNLQRAQSLFEDELIAETELENAMTQLQSAQVRVIQQRSSVQQAEAQIISRDAAIEQAEAALEQARADLEEAELNVGYTVIRSPVNGVVISREVDVGQTVSASTSAPTLFLIANDLSRMQVQAAIDEADIGLLGANNEVTFRVDAYPNDEFMGRIEEIRLNPTTSQNVVTYGVIITFENPDLKLKPGMTANISILVDRRENVVSVPNTALRYSPPADAIVLTSANGGSEAGATRAAPQAEGGFDPANAGRGGRGRGDTAAAADRGAAADEAEPSASYMAGQDWQDSPKITFQAKAPEPPRPGRVWLSTATGALEPRDLMIGLTDGSRTEVASGDIQEGDLVLIGDSSNLSQDGGSNTNADPRNMMRMLGGGGNRGGFGR
jgi:HlyD family secretion protein